MPVFECPKCGKLEVIPLGACEWMLDTATYCGHDPNLGAVYSQICLKCLERHEDRPSTDSSMEIERRQ